MHQNRSFFDENYFPHPNFHSNNPALSHQPKFHVAALKGGGSNRKICHGWHRLALLLQKLHGSQLTVSFLVVMNYVQICGKCCTNNKCNTDYLRGFSEAGTVNLLASLTLLSIMAVVAMVM